MQYTAYEHLLVDVDDGVVTITFDRPEKYNALNDATFFDLRRDVERRLRAVGLNDVGVRTRIHQFLGATPRTQSVTATRIENG